MGSWCGTPAESARSDLNDLRESSRSNNRRKSSSSNSRGGGGNPNTQFSGKWILIRMSQDKVPAPWLLSLQFQDDDSVIVGTGDVVHLERSNKGVSLLGGILSYDADFLCRSGESGKCWF